MRPLVSLLLLAACAHAPPPAQASAPAVSDVHTEVQADTVVRSFDLNHDGKPDDWKTYKLVADPAAPGKTVPRLVKRELDTNFDGKPDVTTWYDEAGLKVREAFDLDFDGRVDVVDVYEQGVLQRKETFHSASSKPDQIAYYEGGRKVRVERDTRGKGKVDTWEYFEDGRLQRIGEDVDGDGIVDRWTKAKDEPGEEAPAAAATSEKKRTH